MRDKFESLLQAYRESGVHFLNLKTARSEFFLILDDSYYLTYRDSSKEIAMSIPLKDFLAVLHKTNCKFFGDYVMFDKTGERLEKIEKNYTNKEGVHIPAQIRNWLHFDEEEMKPFNFELVNPIENFALNLNCVEEITPSPYSAGFIFNNGSVQVLKKILEDKE